MSRSKLSIDPDKPIRDHSVEHSNFLSFDPIQPVAIEIMAIFSPCGLGKINNRGSIPLPSMCPRESWR
jgi:hypothetical protein